MGFGMWLFACAGVTALLAGVMIVAKALIKWFGWCLERLRFLQPLNRWGKYKSSSTKWTIALILVVVLTIYLGAYALYTERTQKPDAPGENTTEMTQAPEEYATETADPAEDPIRFGMDIVLYGIQTAQGILDGDSSKLDTLPEDLQWLGWLVSWSIPFLTVSAAVMLLIGFLPKRIERKKEYLIFPQAEENSLLLAENMMQKAGKEGQIRRDRLVIFLRVDEEKLPQEFKDRMQAIRARKYPYTEGDLLRIHRGLRRKKMRFFFLSADTEVNFSRMKTLLEEVEKDRLFSNCKLFGAKKRAKEEACGEFRQELYLLSESESSPMLIDYLRKRMCTKKAENNDYERKRVFAHTELRLLDRYRTVMYDLMKEKPLYKTADDRRVRILILGFGRVGKAFFRTAASFCPMRGYQTSFTIRGQEMDKEWDLLKLEYPECEEAAKPDKQPMDVMSLKIETLIEKAAGNNKPYTYIMLSLGDDERNIKVASRLARYYLKKSREPKKNGGEKLLLPTICVNLENNIRTEYVSEFFQDENGKQEVPLHVFGTDDKTFSEKMLINRKLWKAARMLHRGLKEDQSESIDYWSEYERRSSIASVAHADWHVYSMKDDMGNHSYDHWYRNIGTNSGEQKELKELLCVEHERWMNYSRCEGMRFIDRDTAKARVNQRKHHADYVAQLTPCLVESKQLDGLYDDLYPKAKEQNKKRRENNQPPYRTFRERDHFVVANAGRLAQIVLTDEKDVKLKGYDELVDLSKEKTK